MFRRPVCLVNARAVMDTGIARSVRFSSRVLSVDTRPETGDTVVDLDGAFVLPGLINAHDHLELNHYSRIEPGRAYGNASEWIDDMRPRLQHDPAIRAGQAYSLADRLLIGGLKNLLSGTTTVAHHNPLYPELRFWFPVRVVRRYGWAHSFFLEGGAAGARGEPAGTVTERYHATPSDEPFFVHLAEGTDPKARSELRRLDRLGCLASNTLLIHGVAFDDTDWATVVRRRAGLIWCPASNRLLFGRSPTIRRFLDTGAESAGRICLGTDARITGSRDLLDEMHVAAADAGLTSAEALRMVTANAARLLRLPDAGRIAPGLPADLLAVPATAAEPAAALLSVRRQDVQLVVVGGRPIVADPELSGVFAARRARAYLARLDERVKLLDAQLVHRLRRCAIDEPGLEIEPRRGTGYPARGSAPLPIHTPGPPAQAPGT